MKWDIQIGQLDVPAICFPSNLHVTGFSSCRVNTMIHSNLVCVCVFPAPIQEYVKIRLKAVEAEGLKVEALR